MAVPARLQPVCQLSPNLSATFIQPVCWFMHCLSATFICATRLTLHATPCLIFTAPLPCTLAAAGDRRQPRVAGRQRRADAAADHCHWLLRWVLHLCICFMAKL